MIPFLVSALKYGPAVFAAGREIYQAATGEPSLAETPEQFSADVSRLPEGQQALIAEQVVAAKLECQRLDTERFGQLTDGSPDKIKATARPEIALRAMGMMETFVNVFRLLIVATLIQWFATWFLQIFEINHPVPSIWSALAEASPVAEMIWAPLLASFYAAIQVITKYMGCRERDKAQEYEMRHGRPLQSAQATVESAGSAISGVIRAFKK